MRGGKAPLVRGPSEIHRALTVVHRRNWIGPVVFTALAVGCITYLLFSRIAVSSKGSAMLLTREKVVPFQAATSGRLERWHVGIGDTVKQGQLIATVAQPETLKLLEQAREKLRFAEERQAEILALSRKFTALELRAIEQKGATIKGRVGTLREEIKSARRLGDENHATKLAYLDDKAQSTRTLRAINAKREVSLAAKLGRTLKLRSEKLATEGDVIACEQFLSDQRMRVAEFDAKLLQNALDRLQAEEERVNKLNDLDVQDEAIGELEQELAQIETRKASIATRERTAAHRADTELAALKREIARYERQLTRDANVYAPHASRILELTVSPGALINRGARLGSLDTRSPEDRVEAVAFFTLKDGKRIKPGMTLRLTPATADIQRHGSLLSVVESVSEYPLTPEGAAKVIGMADVARTLTDGGRQIAVYARLLEDPSAPGRYQQDSLLGERITVESGTVAEAVIDTESRPPITFVVPLLRDWAGF